MRLKPEESQKLAHWCVDRLAKDPNVTLKTPHGSLVSTIEKILKDHFEAERKIDIDAERLYTDRAAEYGAMDKPKAVGMIRKQLATERNFILSGGMEGRFSQDKINHLCHLIDDKLFKDDLVDFIDEDEGLKYFKRLLGSFFTNEAQAIEKVKKKIQSQSNAPFEGSKEWDILFRKYYEEEMRRLNH